MLYRNDNQREPGTPYMRNAAKTQFERTMKREGKIVSTYTGGTEFRAFFRTRDEHENQRESITMYYDVTSPVRPGTLVMMGYGVFLALNRETVENDVFYKATLIKCNGVFNTERIYNLPFYANNMKSSVSVGNSVLSMLNGNIELITEENSLSKQIQINQYFNEFNRTFRVTNKYTMDGIVHLIAEVQADQIVDFVYRIQIDGIIKSISVNSTIQLEVTPYINDNPTTGATFDWKSSDNSIVTVDGTGKITGISEGEAQITVTWVEKDISETINITVVNVNIPVVPEYTYRILGGTHLNCGFSHTFTFEIMDSDNNLIENPDFTWNIVADFVVDQEINGNQIDLYVEDEDLVDEKFVLQAIVGGEVKAEIVVTIESIF